MTQPAPPKVSSAVRDPLQPALTYGESQAVGPSWKGRAPNGR